MKLNYPASGLGAIKTKSTHMARGSSFIVIALIFASLFINSCSSTTDPIDPIEEEEEVVYNAIELVPLQVGNEWIGTF